MDRKTSVPNMSALCVVVIAVTVPLVESGCGKSSVDVSDVLVACPLNMDVSKTRHGIVIARFVNRVRKETVLSCVWNGKVCPHCVSISGWELMGDLTHQVLARVPVSRLHSDSSYTCQEVPPESENPHNDCQVIPISQQGHATDSPQTPTTPNKTEPSTAADEVNTSIPQTTTTKLKASTLRSRDVQTRAENQGVLNGDLLFLTITMICLQLLILAVLILIFLYWRHMSNMHPENKRRHLKHVQPDSRYELVYRNGGT